MDQGFDGILPEDFEMSTILTFSENGFYQGVQEWGEILSEKYQKSTKRRDENKNLNNLSYWTDNGAYYYYNPEINKTYADTLKDVLKSFNQIKISSWNFDSWFYERCESGGTKNWLGFIIIKVRDKESDLMVSLPA